MVLNVEFIYMHEQVLFVHFYGNPALVIRFMQFYYYTARKPGTGADHAFFLSAACSRGLTSHGFTKSTGQ